MSEIRWLPLESNPEASRKCIFDIAL